ncbi:MAG TPA: sugar phosphate nucleotidyltransferase [Planctomycetota bacterium]|nr:sugar phosphate nucleotidyltransferase [Planctomycetota bacterium]HRR78966.1 sugar phosphate nucleotidyltransferase [Planctomycetota bacterium]HRT92988.1 sugar phosphate nucleotidyltransferase [Planctomycetota bacterium]
MKAVLLAAGKGTRMQGLCDVLPKPLLPVANRPALVHTIGQFEAAGVRELLLVIGHQAEQVRAALGGRCGGVRLSYIVQRDPKGTGQATALAEDFAAGEPFLMMFGDIVTSRRHAADIVRLHAEEKPDAVLAVRYFRDPASGGAVYVEGGRVTRIVERPKPGDTTTHYINAGLFVFPPLIFDRLRRVGLSPRGEYELTDAIRMLLDEGLHVRAYDLPGFWVNLTDPATYLEAQRELFGELGLDPPVAIGPGSSIGRCRLGPHASIGRGCTVGDGAHIRDAVVMDGAAVGAEAVVDCAVVGLHAAVPPGACLVGTPAQPAVLPHVLPR